MSRRLDIGVVSYGSHAKLERALASIAQTSRTDWRCFVIDNPGPDPETRTTIERLAAAEPRFVPVCLDENVGYAGGVRRLQELAETEYIAYCDNDVVIQSDGWDEQLCGLLDRHHELGMVFPNGGPFPIDRANYLEVLWGIGFCWILSRMAQAAVGLFDDQLGHQEEADYCLRVRMAGWKIGSLPAVKVSHDATATNNPASIERINAGVVRFVDKWARYFCGAGIDYHSPNVLRWEDWPPNALYLEEYWRRHKSLAKLNAAPEVIQLDGRDYDLIRVPRLAGFYRNRII